MTKDTNTEKSATNDTLAFIIGGIFILGLVFATYNYFSNEQTETGQKGEKQERKLSLEELKETLSTSTEEEDDDEEKEPERQQDQEDAPDQKAEPEGDLNGDGAMTESARTWTSWNPNDYSEGDIEKGEYTVETGDTLWEIAEAAYGDGTMWTKIRDANSGAIDYLPNGQQALIYAGQTLTIPA